MTEREIGEGWHATKSATTWRVAKRGVWFQPEDGGVYVSIYEATARVPLAVFAEVLRLSGYDVSKREGT